PARVDTLHGEAALAAAELSEAGKYYCNITITGATADAAGVAAVTFTVKNGTAPVTGLTAVSAGIFKLEPKAGSLSYNRWVPYIYRPGRTVNAGYRESTTSSPLHGTLVENGGGSYTYTFGTNLGKATYIDNVTLVGYDRALTHRVSVYMGGHNGPTGEGDFDFVPSGAAVSETRNIVVTATCRKCHGPEFAGHGGDRVTVEGCVTCHSPNSAMVNTAANGGKTETIEMAVMIHKMHAGRELASSKGADGEFYDNPWTAADETADNYAEYAYTVGSINATWRTAAFPAVLENCQACHTGSVANVDNWKTVPSRAACGSCHDDIDWATGANHAGGGAANDASCAMCHPASGAGFGQSVTGAHDWTKKDIRNIPEFDITLTLDTPSRGFYVSGETPVATLVLKDHFTGATLDHTTVVQDNAAEGCVPKAGFEGTECTVPRDGRFMTANVYVAGPRAEKVAVLTYAARATVRTDTAGPWDLSAGGGKLRVKVDSGMSMLSYNNAVAYEGYGADEWITGDITVTLPAAGAALNALFDNAAAATAAEVAAWLNNDVTFRERAFAYVDEALPGNANAGKLAIRSRGISKKNERGEVIETFAQRNVSLVTMPVAGMFAAADTGSWKTAGGADSVRKMTTANATNPKAVFSAANIQYTLDPVDDLAPGTYIVHVEYADAQRGPGNPPEPPMVDYRTPSVAVATFNVKTDKLSASQKGADGTEKPVAGNCTACHWSSAGTGFVLDNPRHNKIFDEKTTDRCGGCHDYLSGQKPDATTQQRYAGSLSNRVHSVHNGAALNYPTTTVGHEETSAFGRNWRITYPMDVRSCESCHPASTTSGTWKSNPNRLACMGCHDSDAATNHMKINTFDPTPLAPWSGDEQESCKTCH
ncbi:MAG: OmcA/MtrC family decaheme c-type cytochrome, partial [Deltaproteobacteria bacterium]|nr:OmcA/MtrC family decaheme c-type cytochrome [Deltaproteobacteria bacterium]